MTCLIEEGAEAQLDLLLEKMDVASVWLLDVCRLQRYCYKTTRDLLYSCWPELRSCLGMSRISCRVQSNPTLSCRQPGTFVHAHRREGYRMTYQAYNKHQHTLKHRHWCIVTKCSTTPTRTREFCPCKDVQDSVLGYRVPGEAGLPSVYDGGEFRGEASICSARNFASAGAPSFKAVPRYVLLCL